MKMNFKKAVQILQLPLTKRFVALIVAIAVFHVSLAIAEPSRGMLGAESLRDDLAVEAGVSFKKRAYQTREMEATAYVASDPDQTDSTPCIGPRNINVCELDYPYLASNAFDLGQDLLINGKRYRVMDRMHPRYQNHVDIAMDSNEEAIKFGRRKVTVTILD